MQLCLASTSAMLKHNVIEHRDDFLASIPVPIDSIPVELLPLLWLTTI